MSGSAFHARAARAFIAAGTAVVVGAAAVIAFQGVAPQAVPGPARPAAALESRTGPGAQGAVVPNALLPGAIVSYALYFDTTFVGYARALDGCTMAFDVIETTVKGVAKDLGKAPHVEPCVLEHSMMPNAFEAWIVDQVNNSAIFNPDSLGIVGIDAVGNPVAALRLKRPLLIGFVVPGADASAIRNGYFFSTIDGTLVESLKPSAYPSPSGGKGLKGLMADNFSLAIDAAAVPYTTQVSEIGLGRSDLDRNNPGPWDVSNIDVQTALSKPGPFVKWWSSVLSDPSGTPERSLSLQFLSPTLNPLFQIDLGGVGLYRADSGLRGNRRNFSLYAETPAVSFP